MRARLINDRVSEAAGLFLKEKLYTDYMQLNWETNLAYIEGGHDRDLHSDMITFFMSLSAPKLFFKDYYIAA